MSIVYNGKELRTAGRKSTQDKYNAFIGEKFSNLTVLSVAGFTEYHTAILEVLCECGEVVLRKFQALEQGICISCGCMDKQRDIRTKLGDLFVNIDGEVAEVIEVRSAIDIDVKFLACGTVATFHQAGLTKGNFKNRNTPVVYGVGFIGFGKYSASTDLKVYKRWQAMLQRCYDEKFLSDHPTYRGCSVSAEWHNFQVFAEWFYGQENYSADVGFHLDKDLLQKGTRSTVQKLAACYHKKLMYS